MKKIDVITDSLKKRILKFLYMDEIFNAILIELIQNNRDDIGEIFVKRDAEEITEILHIKNDGNSNLTNFAYTSTEGLKNIADQIKKLNYKKILLTGKLVDVDYLLKMLNCERTPTPNIFYKLDLIKFQDRYMKFRSEIRLAKLSNEDIETVKEFTWKFFEAETEEEINAVTETEKILAKMKSGVYLLEHENRPIGMARFIGKTDSFAEITSLYIDKDYRNKGFGKELTSHMINIAIGQKRRPVLATSSSNFAAIKTYESMGFKRQGEYAFEFLDR